MVYGDVPFSQALAAVPDGDGLAVLVTMSDEVPEGAGPPTLTLWRTDADGARRTALYRAAGSFQAGQPLRRSADGGFVLALGGLDDRMVKLGPDGAVGWTYSPAGTQFVVGTAPAPDGGHVVLSVLDTGLPGLARLDAAGRGVWTVTLGDSPFRRAYAAEPSGDGVAVLGLVDAPGVGVSPVVVTRVDGQGRVVSERAYATGRLALSGLAFAALPDGGFAFASSDVAEDRRLRPPSTVTRIGEDGEVVWARPFGDADQATRVAAVVGLPDGRVVAVGTVGEVFSGFGGDDTDVLAVTYDAR